MIRLNRISIVITRNSIWFHENGVPIGIFYWFIIKNFVVSSKCQSCWYVLLVQNPKFCLISPNVIKHEWRQKFEVSPLIKTRLILVSLEILEPENRWKRKNPKKTFRSSLFSRFSKCSHCSSISNDPLLRLSFPSPFLLLLDPFC